MKHLLDFEIYTRGNPETLILIDTSEFYEYPSNAIVEVQFPNFETIYSDYYNPDKPTVLTTKSLAYSPNRIDFPDGLYFIRVSVAPNKKVFKCKNYLKLDQTMEDMKSLLGDCMDDTQLKEIAKIDSMIVAAKLYADDEPEKSIDMFNLIRKNIKKLKCNGL